MVGLDCCPCHYGRDYLPATAVSWQGIKNLLLMLAALGVLAACSSRSPAPIHDRSAKTKAYQRKAVSSTRTKRPSHAVVQAGDTLYSIAWHYGVDHKTLGNWNGIGPPFTIFPGQKLRLGAPRKSQPAKTTSSKPSSRPVTVKPQASTSPTTTRPPPASRPKPSPAKVSGGSLKWRWPTKGRVTESFVANDPTANGLDIEGQLGQQIFAAAPGEVVYSGVGLIGYGELIIIKHDQHLLSAYGHNRRRLVKEGDQVKAGQAIAEMGKSGADLPVLHFEIRKDGQPVDPKRYLPQ
jgi:lipoprotein NlpD